MAFIRKRSFVWTVGGGAISLLGFLFPTAVVAENSNYNRFSIGPRVSLYDPKEAGDSSGMIGAQLRVPMGSTFALEGSIDYRKDKYANDTIVVHTYPVQASLLAYLVPHQIITPYLLGGAGWYFTKVKVDSTNQDNTDHRLGLHAGGGLQVWFLRRLSLDGSYRYVWMDKLTTQDASLGDKEFDDSGHLLTLALNFHY